MPDDPVDESEAAAVQAVASIADQAALEAASAVSEQTVDAVENVVAQAIVTEALAEGSVALAHQTAAAAELQAAETLAVAATEIEQWQEQVNQRLSMMEANQTSLLSQQQEIGSLLTSLQTALKSTSAPSQQDQAMAIPEPDRRSTKTEPPESAGAERQGQKIRRRKI
jgi:hypothetical protein